MNEALTQLIEFIKNASPLIWSTLIKQVYIEAIATVVWSVGLIILCIVFAKIGSYGLKLYREDEYTNSEWQEGYIFSFIGSVICGAISFSLAVSALMHFSNPEFYAIRYIISILGSS